MQNNAPRWTDQLFSFGGSFTTWMEKAFDVLALGFLWAVFCLPLVTIGASTAALYYTAVKVLRQGRGSLAKEFFRSFRTNLGKGILLWLIFFVLFFLLETNQNIAADMGQPGRFLQAVYSVLTLVLLACALYAFTALSRFDMETGWFIKISIYMTFRYLPTTLLLLAIVIPVGLALSAYPVLVLLLPPCSCLLLSLPVERVLQKHEPPADREGRGEA